MFDLIYKVQLALKRITTKARMERPMIPAMIPPNITAVFGCEDGTSVDVG
jgi:hypothetical protein